MSDAQGANFKQPLESERSRKSFDRRRSSFLCSAGVPLQEVVKVIVEPDFLTHWKTRTLVRLLDNEAAPLCVIALWAHCQLRKTDRLRKVDSFQLASICGYPFADADKFIEAMTTCGFIEIEDGEIVAHDFAQTNAKLFSNWENGRLGGRPSKTHSEPNDNPKKPNLGLEKPIQSNLSNPSTSNQIKSSSFGKSENLLLERVRGLFNKRASTPLDAAEKKAWKSAEESVQATSEKDWQLLEWLYAQRNGDAAKYRHQCMATLLNNWNGQIEKARARKKPSTVTVHGDEQKQRRGDNAFATYG